MRCFFVRGVGGYSVGLAFFSYCSGWLIFLHLVREQDSHTHTDTQHIFFSFPTYPFSLPLSVFSENLRVFFPLVCFVV